MIPLMKKLILIPFMLTFLFLFSSTVFADWYYYVIQPAKVGDTVSYANYKINNRYIDGFYRDAADLSFIKIRVPDTGILTLSMKDFMNVDEPMKLVSVYKKNPTEIPEYMQRPYSITYGEKAYIPVDKGTVYLSIYPLDGKTRNVKIESFKKVKFLANYTRAKTIMLKKNKTVTIIQTPKHHYERWYKIILPKKKTLSFIMNKTENDDVVKAYYVAKNGRMSRVYFNQSAKNENRFISNEKLPKGTYYFCIGWRRLYNGYQQIGDRITFRWQ